MAVIKHRQSERLLNDAVVLDLGDLQRQAEDIIANARREADRILAEAGTEAQRLIDTAADRGHAEGLERGLDEGRERGAAEAKTEVTERLSAELDTLASRLNGMADEWDARREDLLLRAREDVLTFAFALGARIAKRTIAHEPEAIRDQLVEALKLLSEPTKVKIALHPDDRALVEDMLPQLHQSLQDGVHLGLVDDPALARGGCVLSTRGGDIDASIDTQVRRLAEALLPERVAPSMVAEDDAE